MSSRGEVTGREGEGPPERFGRAQGVARFLLGLLALVLTLGSLEIFLRLALDEGEIDAIRGRAERSYRSRWVSHPYLPIVGDPDAEIVSTQSVEGVERLQVVRNNAYGFRTYAFVRGSPDDLVVLCLGGSTTWGEFAPNNTTTWPEILESHLRSRYPNRPVRVYNLGMPTATSASSLVTMALLGHRLNPDLVIVYHGLNEAGALTRAGRWDYSDHVRGLPDVSLPLSARLPVGMRSSLLALWAASRWDDIVGADDVLAYLDRSHSWRDYAAIGWRAFEGGGLDAIIDRASLRTFLENLEAIEALAGLSGARALFSTFQFRDPEPVFVAINEGLRRWAEDGQRNWVDLDAYFPDGDASVNVDGCHFTDDGRRRVAQAVLDAIEAQGLLPPSR